MITLYIPNRNNISYLGSCLAAVSKNRDYFSRIVFSDNGSTDGSYEYVLSKNFDWLELMRTAGNLTYSQHLRWLASKCSSPYVVFLGGDDILEHNAGEELVSALTHYPEAAFVCGRFSYINETGKITGERQWWWARSRVTTMSIPELNIWSTPSNISITAWRTDLLKQLFSSDERALANNAIDWYLFVVSSLYGKSTYINLSLLKYRVHNGSTGNSNVLSHTKSCLFMHFNLLIYLVRRMKLACAAISALRILFLIAAAIRLRVTRR